MTYMVSEDTKISGKCCKFISRSMDILDQSANQSASQAVCPWQTNWLQPASQSAPLPFTDRLTFINDLYGFRRYKNIRKMVSTYISKCGSKGSASQPVSRSICRYLTDRLISASQPVCLYLTDRLTEIIYIYIYICIYIYIYIYIYIIVLYKSLNELFLCRR